MTEEQQQMTNPTIDEQISELHRMLAQLQRSYQKAAQPIVDKLVYLESLKPPKPVIIPIEWPEGQEELLMAKHLLEEVECMAKAALSSE